MSTILHQAVELAQTGRRDEARQLLLQFLQTQPSSEVAWLWLASVAADQSEYERALNEVLRLNPANARAQQLLTEFHQQYRAPFQPPSAGYGPGPSAPPPAAGYAPGPVTPPPPQAMPGLPAQPVVPPSYGQAQPPVAPYYGTPPAAQMGAPVGGARYEEPAERKAKPAEVRVVHERKRSGCLGCSFPGCMGCLGCGGCGQGCLIALLILIVLPVVACVGLSLLPVSLGPGDIPASYLPGEMGRKEIGFTTTQYDVTLTVPRSWYLASANNDMWRLWRDMLDSAVPFENAALTWADYENGSGQAYAIVDVNPAMLQEGGDVTLLRVDFGNVSSGDDNQCSAVSINLPQGAAIVTYPDDLCGYRTSSVGPWTGGIVLKTLDAPAQTRTITFVTPIDGTSSVQWTLTLPETIYTQYADDIDKLIESVRIKRL